MNAEDYQRVRDFFERARELSDPELEAALTQEFGDDSRLANAARELIASDRSAEPTAELAGHGQDRSRPAQTIGPYRLLERLGEGGFGVVWLAEQNAPIRRQVALKIIKPGMDSKQVVARFEAERQALALMDHPNIARILDGGTTDNDRPFFVMELVRGEPITDYCDRHRLGPRERLALFEQVCDAVQHAHQKGVIHRDLKPSNVLVTAQGEVAVPKVIDFGVAKAIARRLTERTLFTEQRQMIGTPEYMSPEQAEMSSLDIDTRTDVYSLGVLLYELLTGTRPFDSEELLEKGYAEMLRVLREVDPPRPSTRISALGERTTVVANARRIDPQSLGRLVAGELDWICMKALEKDRQRRYSTATDLARDVGRYLANEPVMASPQSATYVLRKFVQRHRREVAFGAAILALLVTGLATSIWLWLDAEAARRSEGQRAEEARVAAADARKAQTKAEWASFVANLQAAQISMQANDYAEARRRLADCPPEHRNWVWRHLDLAANAHVWQVDTGEFSAGPTLRDGNRLYVGLTSSEQYGYLAVDTRTGRELARVIEPMTGKTDPVTAIAHDTEPETVWLGTDAGQVKVSIAGSPFRAIENLEPAAKILALAADDTRLFAITSGYGRSLGNEYEFFEPRAFVVDRRDESVRAKVMGRIKGFQGFSTATINPPWALVTSSHYAQGWNLESLTPTNFFEEARSQRRGLGPAGSGFAVWDDNTNRVAILDPTGATKLTPLRGELPATINVYTLRATALDTARERPCVLAPGELYVLDPEVRYYRGIRGLAPESAHLCCDDAGNVAFVVGGSGPSITAIDTREGVAIRTRECYGLGAIAFLPNGNGLAYTEDGALHIRDVSTWDYLGGLDGHADLVDQLVAGPAGSVLASRGQDGTVRIWDLESLELAHVLRSPTTRVYGWERTADPESVALSPDNTRCLVTFATGEIALYELDNGKLIARASDGPEQCAIGDFSADGEYVCLVKKGKIELRDARDLELRRSVAASVDGYVFTISNDGALLAAASDSLVRLIALPELEVVATLHGASAGVSSLSFSPDDKLLAAASEGDPVIRIWDTASRALLTRLATPGDSLYRVAFSPCGERLAAHGYDYLHIFESQHPGWELLDQRRERAIADLEFVGILSNHPHGREEALADIENSEAAPEALAIMRTWLGRWRPSALALLNDAGIGKGYDAAKKTRALAAARRAVELAAPPDRHLALSALGRTLVQLRRFEEAISTLEQADASTVDAGLLHERVPNLALLALAHHGLGQTEAARSALARARNEYRPGDMRIMDDARKLIETASQQIEGR